MSKIFQHPFNPIPWGGTPCDLSGDVTDYPYMGFRTAETTQRFVLGTRGLTWDGRVFKYSRASGAVVSYHGCVANEDYVATYAALPAGITAGSTTASYTGIGRSEDDLAGGYACIYPANVSSIDNAMSRLIVGNEASGSSATTVYIDEPCTETCTASDAIEIFENPYREVYHGPVSNKSVVGVPARTAATLEYIWIQSWGPCVCSMGESGVATGRNREYVFWDNGTVVMMDDATQVLYQHAGFLLNATAANFCGPLLMLQISI